MCLQWGSFTIDNANYNTITFPRAFSSTNYKLCCFDYITSDSNLVPGQFSMREATIFRKVSSTRVYTNVTNLGAVQYIVVGY